MKKIQNRNLVIASFLVLLFVFFVITPAFAEELTETSELPMPSWFKYLEVIGGILAFAALVQGMMLISRVAGGSLAKSFMWYPIGAMFVGISLILRMVTEWGGKETFGLELAFELFIYFGLLFWIIGTSKSIRALK